MINQKKNCGQLSRWTKLGQILKFYTGGGGNPKGWGGGGGVRPLYPS